MKLESLLYSFCGNNLIIGTHIRKQIDFLRQVIPPNFQHRQMDDLGCGDGKVTVLLKDVFLPSKLRGFDVDSGLIKRARSRGIDAEVKDLDTDFPTGEMAVMWGVMHHLSDMEGCLKRLKKNYSLIFIREPVRSMSNRWLELGHTLKRADMENLVQNCLTDAHVLQCGSNLFVFYDSGK